MDLWFKKEVDVNFSCDCPQCPVIGNEFCQNIVKVVCGSYRIYNILTKFMINKTTDAWKSDVNVLSLYFGLIKRAGGL